MKGDILEEFVKEFGSVHENKPTRRNLGISLKISKYMFELIKMMNY